MSSEANTKGSHGYGEILEGLPGSERMPRGPRLLIEEEPAVYHVMSRTALVGYVLKDAEKDYLVNLLQRLSKVYFVEMLGYCIMDNHFHLVLRMLPGDDFDDAEILRRHSSHYGKDSKLLPGQIPSCRKKWASLSEFLKDVKQRFACYYNRLHDRRGYFWGDRFKSVIVENGQTLINCLAYVELNPVRACLVAEPETYRWCSLAYHIQTNNRDGWLSTDFGLDEFGVISAAERLGHYRTFVHEKGGINPEGFPVRDLSRGDLFRLRTGYFTDSAIIGGKGFVDECTQRIRKSCSQLRPKEAYKNRWLARDLCHESILSHQVAPFLVPSMRGIHWPLCALSGTRPVSC